MINLFEALKKHEKTLTEGFETKKWWETQDNNTFERNVIGAVQKEMGSPF